MRRRPSSSSTRRIGRRQDPAPSARLHEPADAAARRWTSTAASTSDPGSDAACGPACSRSCSPKRSAPEAHARWSPEATSGWRRADEVHLAVELAHGRLAAGSPSVHGAEHRHRASKRRRPRAAVAGLSLPKAGESGVASPGPDAVADAGLGDDEVAQRTRRVGGRQLPPQLADVDVDVGVLALVGLAPDRPQEPSLGDEAAPVGRAGRAGSRTRGGSARAAHPPRAPRGGARRARGARRRSGRPGRRPVRPRGAAPRAGGR